MAQKKLSGVLKMYIDAGKAAPSPPLGPALGQVLYYKISFLVSERCFKVFIKIYRN